MSLRYKLLFMAMMVTALAFGFLNVLAPYDGVRFARLHIFLFNLCAGCTILLYYSDQKTFLTPRVKAFLFLSILYAVSAFLEVYLPALLATPALIAIVEIVRIRRFRFLPIDFFKKSVPVSDKFHHAALLCLSIGLLIAGLVIVDSAYYPFMTIPKLELNMFFLGYSFPLSLITMSLIFSIMKTPSGHAGSLKNAAFWTINLGVIIFFGFILAEVFIPQLVVTLVLFASVAIVFYLFVRLGENLQQKQFLISGMGFLVVTAASGIAYILVEFTLDHYSEALVWLMRIHSFSALYGWNLCGLAIICRNNDFPIQLHSKSAIALHWATVLVLAPLGTAHPAMAVIATFAYAGYLYIVLFAKTENAGMGKRLEAGSESVLSG